MIKPDGVKRKLAGEIIRRIEGCNCEIIAMKMLTPSRELAEEHYAVHRGKYFFEPLVDFITSGRVIAMVVEGDNVVHMIRDLMGATEPSEAAPGTIRSDLASIKRENLVHGSDSPESAATEIKLWFPEMGEVNR